MRGSHGVVNVNKAVHKVNKPFSSHNFVNLISVRKKFLTLNFSRKSAKFSQSQKTCGKFQINHTQISVYTHNSVYLFQYFAS